MIEGRSELSISAAETRAKTMFPSELDAWECDGVLTMFMAFRRDQAENMYMTHCLRETGAKVWELLDHNVCGDAKMMAKVRNW